MGPGTSFHRVLLDDAEERPGYSVELKPDAEIRRVILCSGKVYYDLFEEREKRGINDIQILRIEQLYPFPGEALTVRLNRMKNLKEVIWCQEEPKNQGAWSFVEPNIEWVLGRVAGKASRAIYAGRPASASPATGLASQHKAEQEALVSAALAL